MIHITPEIEKNYVFVGVPKEKKKSTSDLDGQTKSLSLSIHIIQADNSA